MENHGTKNKKKTEEKKTTNIVNYFGNWNHTLNRTTFTNP